MSGSCVSGPPGGLAGRRDRDLVENETRHLANIPNGPHVVLFSPKSLFPPSRQTSRGGRPRQLRAHGLSPHGRRATTPGLADKKAGP